MTTSLRNTIHELARSFAASVLDAIRGAPLEEIVSATGGGASSARATPVARGRLERRSVEDIAGVVERIVTLLEGAPDGLRAEQIRSALGLDAKELPRPLADALARKRITKSGEKRATTYFAKRSAKGAKTAKKAAPAKTKKKPALKTPAKPKAKKPAVKAKKAKPTRMKAPQSVPALEVGTDEAEVEVIDAEPLPDPEPEELELEAESAEEPAEDASV